MFCFELKGRVVVNFERFLWQGKHLIVGIRRCKKGRFTVYCIGTFF